jgi:hypothetical protein
MLSPSVSMSGLTCPRARGPDSNLRGGRHRLRRACLPWCRRGLQGRGSRRHCTFRFRVSQAVGSLGSVSPATVAARFFPRCSSSRLVGPWPLDLLGLCRTRVSPVSRSPWCAGFPAPAVLRGACSLSASPGLGPGGLATRALRLTFEDASHRVRLVCGFGLFGALAGPRPPRLFTSTLSWGSQSSSLRRSTLQESTPASPPQQAGREGFGRGMPCPQRVPSSSFLTTSTACSSWALRASRTRCRPWDSSRFRPVRALSRSFVRSLSPGSVLR